MCADGLALHMRAAKTRRALVVAKDGFANFDFGHILFFYVFVDDCPWEIKQQLNNFHWKSVHFRRKVIDEIRRHLRVRRISWWRRRRSCCSTCRAAKPTKGAARHFQITYLMFSLMFRENLKKINNKNNKEKNNGIWSRIRLH